MATKTSQNYLDFVPERMPEIPWAANEDGVVTVTLENTGFFNRFAQRFFGAPPRSYIHLDRYGSYIWLLIDGEHSVYDLSEAVREQFGEDAEPLIGRLVAFSRTLKEHKFIRWKQ